MKKIITFTLATLLALGAVFGLAACAENGVAKTYTITYELNGGTNSPDNPETYTSRTETIIFSAPTREGYLFICWREKDGKKITELKKGSVGNKTLVAEWAADTEKVYTITYNLNGGINDYLNPECYTIISETITLRPAAKPGYSFMGWRNENGESVTEIKKGSVGDIVLSAEWVKSEEEIYTIVYDLGDGINDPANPANYTEKTETITLLPATKEDHSFVCWENENGETVTEITKGSKGNIVLKACWKRTCLTLKFDLENTIRRESYKAQVGFYPFAEGVEGYTQLKVNGGTSVPDIKVNIGESLGSRLPAIDAISGSSDWSVFGWVYCIGDTYKKLGASDIITEELFGTENGEVYLYGCVRSNWIGPY